MGITGLKIYIVATIIYLAIGAYGVYTLYKLNNTLNKTNQLLEKIKE